MFPKNSRVLQSVLQRTSARRSMSSTAKVWIDKNTRVICQGFTGKQVRLLIGISYKLMDFFDRRVLAFKTIVLY